MKKMKGIIKKTVAAAMCAIVAVSFAGCGKKASNSDTKTITIWSGDGHSKLFMEEQVKNWNDTVGKEKGLRIEYIVKTGDVSQQIDLAMENGTAPDLFTSGDAEKLAAQGKIAALDDIKGLKPIMEKYADYMMPSRCQIDGKTYVIPMSATTYGIVYNVDMFKEAGLVDKDGNATPPKTLSELREYAKKLTNPEKKEYGIIFPGKWSEWVGVDVAKMAVPSCGYISGYDPKDGTFNYDAQAETAKTLVGIKKDGSFYPGVEGLDNDPARARFAEGGIGMKTAGSYDYGVFTDQFPAKINWAVAPFPVADENNMYKQHMDISGSLYINSKSLETLGEDAIVEVYNFFYGEDMVKEQYKKGMAIPLNMDWVDGVKVDSSLKHGECWTQFCKLTSVSKPSPMTVKTDVSGKESFGTKFKTEFWPNASSDAAIEKYAKEWSNIMNDGAKKYREMDPDYDPAALSVIVPDWDASRTEWDPDKQ